MFRKIIFPGFSLIELVLCIGLLLIALPLIWMMISFVSNQMLQTAVRLEREKAVMLVILALDRCVSVAEVVTYSENSVSTSGGAVNCSLVSIPTQGIQIRINDKIKVFSDYQSRLWFKVETNSLDPQQILITILEANKQLYVYAYYQQESF